MSSWYDAVAAEFEAIYAEIPKIACKGLCWDACGPIDMNRWERLQLRRAGYTLPPHREQVEIQRSSPDGHYRCPALTDENRCGAYEARPTVCRIWGVFGQMRCPYDCEIEGGEAKDNLWAMSVLDRALAAGTTERWRTEEEFREACEANPELAEAFEAFMWASRPTKTQRFPKD